MIEHFLFEFEKMFRYFILIPVYHKVKMLLFDWIGSSLIFKKTEN